MLCPSAVSIWFLRANRRLPSMTNAMCCGTGPCRTEFMNSSLSCVDAHSIGGLDRSQRRIRAVCRSEGIMNVWWWSVRVHVGRCSWRVFDFFVRVGVGDDAMLAEIGKDSFEEASLCSGAFLGARTRISVRMPRFRLRESDPPRMRAGSPRFPIRFTPRVLETQQYVSSHDFIIQQRFTNDKDLRSFYLQPFGHNQYLIKFYTNFTSHGEHEAGTTTEFGGKNATLNSNP
jgi:hypothetical protein